MRKEYDVKKLKVKRRGLLPGIDTKEDAISKIRITISLDQDVVDYFKSEAKQPGAFPYQTQINQALRKMMQHWQHSEYEKMDSLKEQLLSDPQFIHQLAKKIGQKHSQ